MADAHALLNLDLKGMRDAVDAWEAIATKLSNHAESFQESVVGPLRKKSRWSGEDADEAARTCGRVKQDIDAVAAEAAALSSYLNGIVSAEGDGLNFGNLTDHREEAVALRERAAEKGLTVQADGQVGGVFFEDPAKPSTGQDGADSGADAIERDLKAVMKKVNSLDEEVRDGLEVAFGTEDNFRTEDRDRVEEDQAGLKDIWTDLKLQGVQMYLNMRGWDEAADMLDHFQKGKGGEYEIDADKLLDDLPKFQQDLDGTLEDVRQRPDGAFSTEWQSSSADHNAEDAGNRNWYYALNNFQYRVVGEKNGDELTYHVEVQKDYDWGLPSEHRRDLEYWGAPVFEQADIARLVYVGKAEDYDVTGRTETRTE
ncbi:hypothetical protein [Streptomyces sp. HNM0574]|uniref:hypothetical protein n=1 Tax=Streptomyces sp. HNM0574 TaxID=2714954 RepID=UPI00146E2642|nr:hypothetical protein [Streptomyces sp. HNM0574]NLU68673.1 hypothetical protein [Streptomyces sp. HNM0574]